MAYATESGVSWGQRKALGRKYSIDPAYSLESDRLNTEYALRPQREALAENTRRFDVTTQIQQDQYAQSQRQQAISGGVSLAGTLAGADIIGNKGAGIKAIWSAGKEAFSPSTTPSGVDPSAPAAAGGAATGAYAIQPGSNIGAGGAGSTMYDAPAVGGTGEGAAVTGLGGVAAGGAAGGYVGGKVGQPIGEALNVGGKSERATVGGAAGGAAAGAYMGATYGTVGGPVGALIGAVVGGAVGFLTKDSWLCTEIDKRIGVAFSETESLSVLRRYSIKNHREESEKYYKNGHLLVDAINAGKDSETVYSGLKGPLVKECTALVKNGDKERAYQLYKEITEALCREYNVDLSIKEGK